MPNLGSPSLSYMYSEFCKRQNRVIEISLAASDRIVGDPIHLSSPFYAVSSEHFEKLIAAGDVQCNEELEVNYHG